MTRISVDQEDPGWTIFAVRARVFINGIERNNVITADEEQRLAICYVMDQNGQLTCGPDNEPLRETVHGDVLIKWPD